MTWLSLEIAQPQGRTDAGDDVVVACWLAELVRVAGREIVAVSGDLADAVGAQGNHVLENVLLNRATMGRSCIDDALTDGFTKLGIAMVIETGQDRSRLGSR